MSGVASEVIKGRNYDGEIREQKEMIGVTVNN
jgi:hypothetical protein